MSVTQNVFLVALHEHLQRFSAVIGDLCTQGADYCVVSCKYTFLGGKFLYGS